MSAEYIRQSGDLATLLSTRSARALQAAGITRVEEAGDLPSSELLAIPGLGAQGVAEVHEVIRTGESSGAAKRSRALGRDPERAARHLGGSPELVRSVHAAYRAAVPDRIAEVTRAPLARVLSRTVRELKPIELAILDLRLKNTLEVIGSALGVTRERVRQVEKQGRALLEQIARETAPAMVASWEEVLATSVRSERDLFGPWEAAEVDDRAEFQIGRMILSGLGANPPATFKGHLQGWWTLDPDTLVNSLRGLVRHLPLEDDDMTQLIAQDPVASSAPTREILGLPGSPILYQGAVNAWTRRVGAKPDAAYLLLTRAGSPLDQRELAERIGMKAHALREALARDARFKQLRPGSRWALSEWLDIGGSEYRTTLDAAVAVLSDLGPLPYPQFERRVIERYPVSTWAVKQCLGTDAIGRWPDGKIDLVERGATPVEDSEPPCPGNVDVQGDTLRIELPVDYDLLRGSGVAISTFVTWWLGLRLSPREMTFATDTGRDLIVRRLKAGSSTSTLRSHAERLGADEGTHLVLLLDRAEATATIRAAA